MTMAQNKLNCKEINKLRMLLLLWVKEKTKSKHIRNNNEILIVVIVPSRVLTRRAFLNTFLEV